MIKTRQLATTFVIGGVLILGASSCGIDIDLGPSADGSGVAETTTFDLADFDEIRIGSAFNADIAVADGPASVEVTLDDNLFEYLVVDVDGDRLTVRMDAARLDYDVEPVVVIRVPELTELDLSGASDVNVVGVEGERFDVEMSGASELSVEAAVERISVVSSGASDLRVDGEAATLDLVASGASAIDLEDLVLSSAELNLSGASNVDFGPVEDVTGQAGGASTVHVGRGTMVSVSTSGASSVTVS